VKTVSTFLGAFGIVQVMPRATEARIQKLCNKAIEAKSKDDVERVITELRSALEEHIRLAKQSLSAQASAISVLSSKAQMS
jgi:RNA binding exosome subunit